jgi:hypothetical protein
MNTINSILVIMVSFLTLCTIVGGIFVFRNAKRSGIIMIQDQTIQALQQQIDAVKEQQIFMREQQVELQKENTRLQFVIETIGAALKRKGILISIEGEMVTVSDARDGSSSTLRRQSKVAPLPKKEKET